MDQAFAEYAGRLTERQPPGRALLVAIDGRGGSGKSTFATFLEDALRSAGQTAVTTVAADGFVLNQRVEDWRPLPSRPDVRAPYRIDVDRLRRELLEPLHEGSSAQFLHRDWWNAASAEVRTVPSQGIVLVEGAYTLHTRLRDLYDERIFLDCPADLALQRALARDVPRSRDALIASLVWREIHAPVEAAYLREQNPRAAADLVVESVQPIGPECFVTLNEGSPWSPSR
jgi:uridine kinase